MEMRTLFAVSSRYPLCTSNYEALSEPTMAWKPLPKPGRAPWETHNR